MPGIVRLGDVCSGHGCFPPRPNIASSTDVLANGVGVHRVGDSWAPHTCHGSTHDGIAVTGSPTVFVNGVPITRIGDTVSCGSSMSVGSSDSIAGNGGPGDFTPTKTVAGTTLPQNENSIENAKKLYEDADVGTIFAIGDEYETSSGTFPPIQTTPPKPIDKPALEQNTTPPPATQQPVTSCKLIDPNNIDYDMQLSPNFRLRQLSINAVYQHTIKAQRGLSVQDIICNLQALAENVLEPLRAKYPGFRINSGFRTMQNGKSQHETGQAADCQFPNATNQQVWEMAQWVKDNLDYDQFIFEHGNKIWLHLSYNRGGNRAATASNKVMTMLNGQYSPGLQRHYL